MIDGCVTKILNLYFFFQISITEAAFHDFIVFSEIFYCVRMKKSIVSIKQA